MPDFVYALHDFLPEHEDEVSFHAGERIEVVERDDLYGDGWWQVCYLSPSFIWWMDLGAKTGGASSFPSINRALQNLASIPLILSSCLLPPLFHSRAEI